MKLPKPDAFGNYWLNEKREAPAIMRSKRRVWNTDAAQNDVVDQGHYFATTKDGPIFDGNNLKKFATPLEALQAIEGIS